MHCGQQKYMFGDFVTIKFPDFGESVLLLFLFISFGPPAVQMKENLWNI